MSEIHDPFSLGESDIQYYGESKKRKYTFDFVRNVEKGGDDLFENNPEMISDYSQYLMELHFFKRHDCIFYVNEINKLRGVLPDELHYDYFKDVIPKSNKSFFRKKKEIPNKEILEKIIEKYNVSLRIAKFYFRILNQEQLEKIKSSLDKGGR